MTPKHPPGPPMDLANMRAQGVHHLIAFCLNDACRHQARARQSRTGGRWCAQRVGTCPPGRLGIGINGPLLRLFPEMAAYAGCRRGLSTSGEPRWGAPDVGVAPPPRDLGGNVLSGFPPPHPWDVGVYKLFGNIARRC
jgi:hypothetical protein